MKRRQFVKAAGLTATGAMVAPMAIGRDLSGNREVKHTFLCVLGGGVRASDFLEALRNSPLAGAHSFYSTMIFKGGEVSHQHGLHALYNGNYEPGNGPGRNLLSYHQDSFCLHSSAESFPAFQQQIASPNTMVNTVSDHRTLEQAGRLFSEKLPALTAVNLCRFDIAHSNAAAYRRHLESCIAKLSDIWTRIESDPRSAGRTQLVITTDIGRDAFENAMGGLDHTDESCSRETFCFVAGAAAGVPELSEPVHLNAYIAGTLQQESLFGL